LFAFGGPVAKIDALKVVRAMMDIVTQAPAETPPRPFLNAIATLNVQRRDDALYLLGCDYGKPFTPYDICKTQVLADVFHVIHTGKVVFGGRLYAMPFGPVTERTLDHCRQWATGALLATMLARPSSAAPQPLQPSGWTGSRNHIPEFRASPEYSRRDQASWDWFSDDEQRHIRSAYETVISMSWPRSQAYFHEPISAIGYAYDTATKPYGKPFKGRADMNWFDVLDGAERIESVDVNYARAMLGLWT
jgi:hypothetical protein